MKEMLPPDVSTSNSLRKPVQRFFSKDLYLIYAFVKAKSATLELAFLEMK